jgi:hypothetical protein
LTQFDVSSFNKKIQKLNDENLLLKKSLVDLNSNQQIYSVQGIDKFLMVQIIPIKIRYPIVIKIRLTNVKKCKGEIKNVLKSSFLFIKQI